MRKTLNQQQTELRQTMMSYSQHEKSIELFLRQHAMLHSEKMAQTGAWSYEDELLDDISDEKFRYVSKKDGHSIAWCIWHIARIEDVAMNILVVDKPQILNQDDWLAQMNLRYCDTGNAMPDDDVVSIIGLLTKVEPAYRTAMQETPTSLGKTA